MKQGTSTGAPRFSVSIRKLGNRFIRAKGARVGLTTLVVLAAGVSGSAQQSLKLSLQEALIRAERQNLDLVAAREKRAFALAGIQVARQRPNPVLSFSASRDAPHEGFILDQPLELGPKRSGRIEVARDEAVLTDLEIAALSRQVRHSVRDAFYQAQFTRAVSEQKAQLLTLARRLLQIAQTRFQAGDVAHPLRHFPGRDRPHPARYRGAYPEASRGGIFFPPHRCRDGPVCDRTEPRRRSDQTEAPRPA